MNTYVMYYSLASLVNLVIYARNWESFHVNERKEMDEENSLLNYSAKFLQHVLQGDNDTH